MKIGSKYVVLQRVIVAVQCLCRSSVMLGCPSLHLLNEESEQIISFTELHLNVPSLSIEWNSIRLGDPAHGIVTKTVHKTLPGGCGGPGGRGV